MQSANLGARLGDLPSPGGAGGGAGSGENAPMRLVLQLQAAHLAGLDTRRHLRHDYFATAEVRDPDGGDGWVDLGKTEVVYGRADPAWANTFSLEYSFNVAQLLRFRVHRLDPSATAGAPRRFEALGEVQCTVATIVLADKQVVSERLRAVHSRRPTIEPRPPPTLSIRAEEERGDLGDSVTLQFVARNLRRGAKPFYTLMRENADRTFSPVQFSEVHRSYDRRSNRDNHFKPLTVSLAKLVNGDLGRKLRIEFKDYEQNGHHRRGGHADFTLNGLRAAQELGRRPVFKLFKDKNNGVRKEAGVVTVSKFEITNSYTFLDYIRAGVEINCVFAVDMSSTNGNPRDPNSLQYNSRSTPNEYVVALREIGAVLDQYDTDKRFPAYGFSACLPLDYRYMSYCFALSGNASKPLCDGIEGVISKYYDSLDYVAPHQPCHMNPVIQHVVTECSRKDRENKHTAYTVLLLITDGDYQDQKRVADTICAAADLPLSIVIVGVGNSDFPLLDELDGDDVRLCNSEGVPAARDIVQVVHFHKHRHSPAALARETLAEIPSQLISYMRSQGLRPSDIEAIRRSLPSTPSGLHHEMEPPMAPPTPEPPSNVSITVPDALEPSDSRHSFYSASSDGTAGINVATPQGYAPPAPVYQSPLVPPADVPAQGHMQASILTLNLPPAVLAAQHGHGHGVQHGPHANAHAPMHAQPLGHTQLQQHHAQAYHGQAYNQRWQ